MSRKVSQSSHGAGRATAAALPGRDRQRVLHLLAQNRGEDAERLCDKLCRRYPADVDALLLMASVHAGAGRLEAVVEYCQRALALDAGNETALYNLAVAAQQLGRLPAAEGAWRELLQRRPDSVAALGNLGALLLDKGEIDAAVQMLEKAVEQAPDDAPAWYRLGQALFNRSQAGPAVGCYRRALEIQPDFHEARYALASLLSVTGEYDEALKLYRQLLEVQPDSAALHAAIGNLYEFRGEKGKARDYLRPWLAKRGSPEIAAVYARCVEDDDGRREAAALLEDALAAAGRQQGQQRRDALYALGKLYDRLGEYPRAFSAFEQANRLENHALDMASLQRMFAELREPFDRSALAYRGHPSTRPVFVVGMPRSGTTLVEQILASHSQVHGAGELDDMARLVNRVRRECGVHNNWLRCLPQLSADFLESLAGDYLERLNTLNTEASRVVDKMPHNFLALGLISVLFPQARVIHCRRDPRDTCLSVYFQHFSGNHPYTSDLHALGRYYRLYHQLMQHWKAVLPLQLLEIDYRDVVLAPEPSARRLIEFCGLDWQPQCLEFYRNDQLVTTPTYSDVRQPIYSRALDRWTHYAGNIQPLLAGLGDDLLQ